MSNLNEVFEDIEVPNAAGDGPRYEEQSLRIFCVMTPPSFLDVELFLTTNLL